MFLSSHHLSTSSKKLAVLVGSLFVCLCGHKGVGSTSPRLISDAKHLVASDN